MQELRHLLVQEQKRLETIINKARSGISAGRTSSNFMR